MKKKDFKYTWVRINSKTMHTEEQMDGTPDWMLTQVDNFTVIAKHRVSAMPKKFGSMKDAMQYANEVANGRG